MPRARPKPHDPSKGDLGPTRELPSGRTVYMQPGGYVMDTPKDANEANGMKTRVIGHALESMHADGTLTAAEYTRAHEIREAIGKTEMTGGEFAREYVDSSPKPDAAIAIQVDRMSDYNWAMRGIPSASKGIVHDICGGLQRHPSKDDRSRLKLALWWACGPA